MSLNATTSSTTITQPNILLVVMDTTRAMSLSFYGHERFTTPNINELAKQSVVYDQAISAAGWSLPTHASIFTGLYPSTHLANDEHKYLNPEHKTMAELLHELGYFTIAFCDKDDVSPATGLDRGFQVFHNDRRLRRGSLSSMMRIMDVGLSMMLGYRDKGARRITARVRTWLRHLNTADQPFFMFVNYGEAHLGRIPPPRKYRRRFAADISGRQLKSVNQNHFKYLAGAAPMQERDFGILRALYDANIAYQDSCIGRVIGELDRLELLDRTLVIIIADHGENLGEHSLLGHAYCLYDTVVHVPLLIRFPNKAVRPHRVAHQVQTLDLLPTILSVLGDTSSDLFRSLPGYSLLSSQRHPFTTAEQAYPDLGGFGSYASYADVSRYARSLKMIRTERHKYIWGSDGNHELYDLGVDPSETNNVVDKFPDLARDLDYRLKKRYARLDRRGSSH